MFKREGAKGGSPLTLPAESVFVLPPPGRHSRRLLTLSSPQTQVGLGDASLPEATLHLSRRAVLGRDETSSRIYESASGVSGQAQVRL